MATSGFAAGVDPFAFFGQLRREGHDTLEIIDVALFCLICYGGKPICAGCSRFVPGDDYFTCLQCFTTDGNIPFNLCPDCNRNIGGHLDHVHPENDYIDNVKMLQLQLQNEGNEHQMGWGDPGAVCRGSDGYKSLRNFILAVFLNVKGGLVELSYGYLCKRLVISFSIHLRVKHTVM
ncbi:hypothetical protein SAY86_011447 [Trapa natans]|uniref:Uncharacterized protein n=1 Tax=Trapa natans TaxID=22666 RepID=A0AAN7LM73_TRANT|nr:hypothetical protein SAY86_011447 [Trapa natans]